jgi:RHS repeat-associated protein
MILQVAAELDGQGALRWRFVYATGKHLPDAAIDAAGVVYRLVTDQVGSLRLVARASDGAVLQRMRHDAWGAVEEDFVAAGFARVPFARERNSAGGLVDQVTGLVLSVHTNSGAREYDPVVGRWVEKDPIRWGGGTMGLYEYVGNAPVGRVDPSGLLPGDPGWDTPIADGGWFERDGSGAPIGWALGFDGSGGLSAEERQRLADELDSALPDPPSPVPGRRPVCVLGGAILGGAGLVGVLACPDPRGKAVSAAIGVAGVLVPFSPACERPPLTGPAPTVRGRGR